MMILDPVISLSSFLYTTAVYFNQSEEFSYLSCQAQEAVISGAASAEHNLIIYSNPNDKVNSPVGL